MWGWRARLGFIIPGSDLVQESDMFCMTPEGVSVHFTRKSFGQPFTMKDLEELGQNLEPQIQLLTPLGVSVITFGDTSASFIGGPGYDQKIVQSIAKASGVKGNSTATSVVAAMKALGMKRISVLTPYKHVVNERLIKFFEGNGFEILKMKELELDTDWSIAQVTPEIIFQFAEEAIVPEADGIFITCTTLRAADTIDVLERSIRKPVVTSNQATMWNSLRKAGIKDKVEGYGQLFANM